MTARGVKGLGFMVKDLLFIISYIQFPISGLRLKDYGLGFKV